MNRLHAVAVVGLLTLVVLLRSPGLANDAGPVPTPLPTMQLPAVPEVAPGYNAPPVAAPGGEIVGVTQRPFVGIRLDDAVSMALAKNTDIAVAQENRRIAGWQIVAAKGAYDVTFAVTPSYTHQVSAPLSVIQAGPGGGPISQDELGANGSVAGTIAGTGTQLQVTASGQRVTNDAVVNSFNPYYTSAMSLNVTQPLLRGFASDQNRRELDLARINAAASTDALLLTATNTVVSVENAYWDLVSAWRNVAIQEEGLRNALAQAETTQRSATAGRIAPIQVTESNAQVAQFQDSVLSALQNVQRQQTQIKSLILDDSSDPIWSANLVPTSAVEDVPAEPTLDAVLTQALRNRPEIAQLREQRNSDDVGLAYAREQLKPTVNLQLGYTTNGLAGAPNSPSTDPIFSAFGAQFGALNQLIANANKNLPASQQIPFPAAPSFTNPSYLNGGLGTAVNSLLNNRFPTYNAQLNVAFPLGNKTAKANYEVAKEQLRSLDVQQVALIQRIKNDALNALQTLRETRYRLTSARASRESSEAVLSSEERRYKAGSSTTFLVLQRQVDLANARGRELQAQTDLNKAVVELERVNGTILSHSGLDVEKLGSHALK